MAKVGYPTYGEMAVDAVNRTPDRIMFRKKSVMVFLDSEEVFQFILAEDSVIVQTSHYSTFDEFAEQLRTVIPVIQELLGDRKITRIGLRYVNRLRPAHGRTFADYLEPRLLGFPLEGHDGDEFFWRSDNFYPVENGSMSIRCSHLESPSLLPPGVEPLGLKYKDQGLNSAESSAVVLDIDCHSRPDCAFNLEAMFPKIQDLNDRATRLFMKSITPYARSEWQETTTNASTP
jgi:uncharacterized protein (TIGR04255 family)